MLENIELNKLVSDQQEQQEIEELRNFQVDTENPQVEADPTEQERFKEFLSEVEALGNEQVGLLDKRMSKFDEIQKQIDLLNQQLEPKFTPDDTLEQINE